MTAAPPRFGIILSIENYQKARLPQIDYALNDARHMKMAFHNLWNIPETNLLYLTDSEASISAVKNEVAPFIEGLPQGAELYIYYTGHALHESGETWLSVFDTYPSSPTTTALALQADLLDPIAQKACSTVLVFLDTSPTDLPTLENFCSTPSRRAIFSACAPEQRSYVSSKLQHSVWAAHLLRALRGQAPESLDAHRMLTAPSLQNYLHDAVAKFVREEMNFESRQNPHAAMAELSPFVIHHHDETLGSPSEVVTALEPNFKESFWRSVDQSPFKKHPNFNRQRHFEPERLSSAMDKFALELTEEDAQNEIKKIYENCVSRLGLKRSSLKKGERTLDCSLFRFTIDASQDTQIPRNLVVHRRLKLLVEPASLPLDFDDVFPRSPDELVIPYRGQPTHLDLLKLFEIQEENTEARLEEDEAAGYLRLRYPEGATLAVHRKAHEISLSKGVTSGVMSLSRSFATDLANLGLVDKITTD